MDNKRCTAYKSAATAPLSCELVRSAQYMIEIGLRRSIGEEVEILEVDVRVENETLYIRIDYQQPKTKEPRSLEFSRNMTG